MDMDIGAYYGSVDITPELVASLPGSPTHSDPIINHDSNSSNGQGTAAIKVPATKAGLRLLVSQHAMAHPYQNVDLILARINNNSTPVDIHASTLEPKFVTRRRGGMCYEGSEFLYHVLTSHGFDVKRISAAPLNNNPYVPGAPHTHNILIVAVDNECFIVDPFFGYNGLRHPMPFNEAEEVQEFEIEEYNERYKLQRFEDHYVLYMYVSSKDEWFSMYRFDRPVHFVSYEDTCQLHLNLMTFSLRPMPIRDQFIKIGSMNNAGRIGVHIDFKDPNSRFLIVVRDGVAEKIFFTPENINELVDSIPKYIPHLDKGIVEDIKYILSVETA